MPLRLLVIIALSAALAASGCGRRGALQPPPGAPAPTEEPQPFERPTPPERDFVLDPLL
jgi:predicted small lipoprotein YifL